MDQLNQFLQPINSPVGQPSPFDLAMDFQVHNDRNIIGNAQVSQILASKIQAGSIQVSINVGSSATTGYLLLQGGSTNFIVNDGTNNIILLGKQAGGF